MSKYCNYETNTHGTIDKPSLGDIRNYKELGIKQRGWYIWHACEKCGLQRWVWLIKNEPYHKMCVSCRNEYSKVNKNGMKQNRLGDIKSGIEFNIKSNASYIYKFCDQCKQGYWINIKDDGKTNLCRTCYCSRYQPSKEYYDWAGGYINKHGYRIVTIDSNSPYYPMGQKHNGKTRVIAEHRLVMAMSKGGCLENWEIPHHKGTRYPIGSWEDKHDNRIENLSLETNGSHQGYTTLQYQNKMLEKRVAKLEEQVENNWQFIRLLLWQNNGQKVSVDLGIRDTQKDKNGGTNVP